MPWSCWGLKSCVFRAVQCWVITIIGYIYIYILYIFLLHYTIWIYLILVQIRWVHRTCCRIILYDIGWQIGWVHQGVMTWIVGGIHHNLPKSQNGELDTKERASFGCSRLPRIQHQDDILVQGFLHGACASPFFAIVKGRERSIPNFIKSHLYT